MGKRKNKEIEDLKKRLKKLEKKRRTTRLSSSSSTPSLSPLPPGTPPPRHSTSPPRAPTPELQIDLDEEEIPEEFLIALGEEGERKKILGEPIHPQIATRWQNIMVDGLGKESREKIIKKYPSPTNFTSAAPEMNPEIAASMSEPSTKRDKRIIIRQNMVGTVMSAIGKATTQIMKGNINSKEIIEVLSDAAKLSAEVFYMDSSSRKFFALAGATKVIQDAVRNEKSDSMLFGQNFSEKIRAAQSIQKTGSQIKAAGAGPPEKKQKETPRKVNWRGPLQNQQRARSGPYQQQYQHQYQQQPQARPRQATQAARRRTQPQQRRQAPTQSSRYNRRY